MAAWVGKAQGSTLPDKKAASTKTAEQAAFHTAWRTERDSTHFWDEREKSDLGKDGLSLATGMQVELPKEWNGKVITKAVSGTDNNGTTLVFMDKEAQEGGVTGALCYLEYVNRKIASDQEPYEVFPGDRVLGTYKMGNQEFALIFELPMEKDYVAGDEAAVRHHKKLYALVDKVRVITKDMPGFTPCEIDDLNWVTCDSWKREKQQAVPSIPQMEKGAQHLWDEDGQNGIVQKRLNFATGMRIILPEQWNGKVRTEIDLRSADEGGAHRFSMWKMTRL